MILKLISNSKSLLYGLDIQNFLSSQKIVSSIIYFSNKTNLNNLNGNNILIVSPFNSTSDGMHFKKINKKIFKYISSDSLIAIDLDESVTFKYMCFLIKNLIKLFTMLKKKHITLNYNYKNSIIIGLLSIDNTMKYFDDICTTFMALSAESKNKQYEIIYDAVCNYLDNEFISKNLCGFCDDSCNANRQGLTHFKKNGCCYTFDYLRTD